MVKAEDYLKQYIEGSAPYSDHFFLQQKKIATGVSPIAAEMVEIYRRFLGGKRLRGALTYGSYKMFGGQREEDILQASLIIEIIHAFGLIHDDIMDEDRLRRGQPTAHVQYEDSLKEKSGIKLSKNNPQHFGLSMALDLGDLGPFFSNLILYQTKFSPKTKMDFLEVLSETIVTTIYGQGLDINFELDPNPTQDKVLKVHLYKTANYTVIGPLRYGAVLAGVSKKSPIFKALEGYGRPVGIAFQLRDDELGMFSSEKKLGKPVDSDLREGKNTLLFSKAFENGNPEQISFLRYAHGNKNLTERDLEKARGVIVETGALEFSQKESHRLVEEGKKHIPEITRDKHSQELLAVLADYVVKRNS